MTANEIVPGLWVGDMNDGAGFEGARICVLEQPCPHGCRHHPILRQIMVPQIIASIAQLESLAAVIEAEMKRGRPVLVHCGAGIERSPLSVAWFLHTRRGVPLAEAYQQVLAARPQAQDRTAWLG